MVEYTAVIIIVIITIYSASITNKLRIRTAVYYTVNVKNTSYSLLKVARFYLLHLVKFIS